MGLENVFLKQYTHYINLKDLREKHLKFKNNKLI